MSENYLEDRPTPPSLELGEGLTQAPDVSPTPIQRLRKRRGLLVGLVLSGAIVLLTSGLALWSLSRSPATWSSWLALVVPTSTPSTRDIAPPLSLKELSAEYPQLSKLLDDATLSSVYKDFMIAYEDGGAEAARELASRRGLLNDRAEIRLTLVVDRAQHVSPVISELVQAGITVEGSYDTRINVGVPLSLIQRLSAEQGADALFGRLTQMEHIIRLELPLPNTIDRRSHVEGEGVSVTGADVWHQSALTGQGIRVGILDMGFDGYRDLLGSELPERITAKSFVYGKEPDGSDEVHGTACAEIVHEMAPGAELLLAYYDGTLVSEGQAVEWLLEQDVHIISHSAGSVMAPMDGTGQNAELADWAASQGVLWVNSAGNEALGHHRAQFTDEDGDGLHEFPDGSEQIAIEAYAETVTVVLNWDDWETLTEDYDIYVYDGEGTLIASAEDAQDGSPGQVAAEGLVLHGAMSEVYYVSVLAYQTTRPARLDLYVPGADIEFPMAEHSLNSPADARGAVTVGATLYGDDTAASYSSQGPTTDGRLKPDISAPAGVSGATYGPAAFDGTSASAPHVAGAAALVWSAFPGLDRDGVVSHLTTHALDLGPAGPDSVYGHGRVELAPPPAEDEAALPAATEPPAPTVTIETIAPSTAPHLTPTPFATLEPTEESVTPAAGGSFSSTTSSPPSALLMGLFLTGLCGGVAVVGGVGLLLVSRHGFRPRLQEAPPFSPARVPPSVPGSYGRLEGIGLDPIRLREGTVSLGRDSDNDVVLKDPKVSRHHARIVCADGACMVEDLGSSNGTFIDGERVTRSVLSPGNRLRLGDIDLVHSGRLQEDGAAWLRVGEARYPVPATGASIGRSRDSDIRLTDRLASRRHARIDRRGGEFVLADLDSTNGTLVNGRRVRAERLRSGDRIRIGKTQLRFHRQAEP